MSTTDLVLADHAEPPAAPVPMFGGDAMAAAFAAYQQLQRSLDASMPDQIIRIDGRPFRCKGYWRAIAVAFNLTVEPLEERREVQGQFDDKRDNFGYLVTYRATAPNGRRASGDGSCFAIEKAPRSQDSKWATIPRQATEHNIRSHAHTRAFNRAVSNLVGFGEVSAEEIERDDDRPRSRASREATISAAQQKRLFAIATKAGWTTEELRELLHSRYSISHSKQIPTSRYDQVVRDVEQPPTRAANPPAPTTTADDIPF